MHTLASVGDHLSVMHLAGERREKAVAARIGLDRLHRRRQHHRK
jgi:hypothetical protein